MILKKIFISILLLLATDIFLIPIYLFMGIGLIFNDSGYQSDSFKEFIFSMGFVFLILLGSFILAYVVLKRFKCNTIMLHFIFIPTRFIIFTFIFCLFMQVYLNPKIDEKINPLTIHFKHKEQNEVEKIALLQEKEFQSYKHKQNTYEKIHSFNTNDGYFALLMNKKSKDLFILYQGNNTAFFKPLPAVDYKTIEKEKMETKNININSPFSPKLVEKTVEGQMKMYIVLPKEKLAFEIPEEKIVLSNEVYALDTFVRNQLIGNLNSYNITFEDGKVYRTGEIGEDVAWLFERDGKQILQRNAKGETSVDLSSIPHLFDKEGVYRAYITTDVKTKTSNTVQWTHEKSNLK